MKLKVGLAEKLKGGVIMDVTTPEKAKIAEDAGACAGMALFAMGAIVTKDSSALESFGKFRDGLWPKRITCG